MVIKGEAVRDQVLANERNNVGANKRVTSMLYKVVLVMAVALQCCIIRRYTICELLFAIADLPFLESYEAAKQVGQTCQRCWAELACGTTESAWHEYLEL